MRPRRSVVSAVVVGAVVLLLLGGVTTAWRAGLQGTDSDTPPRIVLRGTGGAEQTGEPGGFCWQGTCVDTDGTAIPRQPVTLRAGETIHLDFTDLGAPDSVQYKVFRYAEAVGTPSALPYIDPARMAVAAQDGILRPGSVPAFSLNLPPDHYVMEVFTAVPGRYDTLQGFNIVLEPADPAAGATATLPPGSIVHEPKPDVGSIPTPDIGSIPEAAAPAGLGDVALPDDTAAVADLFARLPAAVAGQPLRPISEEVSPDAFRAAYGDAPSGVDGLPDEMALNLRRQLLAFDVQGPPQFTAGVLVARDILNAQELPPGALASLEIAAGGRDGSLFWARGLVRVGGPNAPTSQYAEWGLVNSRWRFGARGETDAEVDALIAAFVAAARSQASGAPASPTPTFSPTLPATPITRDIPAPEECRVAPRDVDKVRLLVEEIQALQVPPDPAATPRSLPMIEVSGEPPNVTVTVNGTVVPQGGPPPTPPPFTMPEGWPADATTVAAITATYREWIACRNALSFLRAQALVTDAHFRRSIEGTLRELSEAQVIALYAERVPRGASLPAAERTPMPEVREIRLLPDGRAAVLAVVTDVHDGEADARSVYVEFARVGDRWLFDSFESPIDLIGTPTP